MKLSHLIFGAAATTATPLESRGSSSGAGLQVQRTFSAGDVGYAILTLNAAPELANVAWPAIDSACGARFNVSARPSPEVPDKFLSNAADDIQLQLYTTRVSGSDAETCIVNATLRATHGYVMAKENDSNMFFGGLIGASVGIVPWAILAAGITFAGGDRNRRLVPQRQPNPLAMLEYF